MAEEARIVSFEESEARYRHLIEHSTDVIYWTNDQGRFTFFGPIAMRKFGYTREQLLGRHYLDMVRPDRRHAVRRFYDRQWLRRIPDTYQEIPVVTEDGREVWLGQNVHLIQTGDSPSGFQVVARDITSQKQSRAELEREVAERTAELRFANDALSREMGDRALAEEERRRVEGQLRQVQRMDSLGMLAGGVAHEFNNLLMIISGYTEILRASLLDSPKFVAYLERILAASRRGVELVQRMLDYAGKGKLEPKLLHLAAILAESVPAIEERLGTRVKLILDLSNDELEFKGDPAQVKQIVMNLVLNAFDALEDHGGVVHLRTSVIEAGQAFFAGTYFGEQLTPGTYISMEVIDAGCGMDAATESRIFEPFFTTKFMGRGLGLASVLGMVKSHAGTIVVHSALGEGTNMQVVFPAYYG